LVVLGFPAALLGSVLPLWMRVGGGFAGERWPLGQLFWPFRRFVRFMAWILLLFHSAMAATL